MPLPERFKNLTAGTPLRMLVSSILITLLIPATLLATTQRWELRREAAVGSTTLPENVRAQGIFDYIVVVTPHEGDVITETTEVVCRTSPILEVLAVQYLINEGFPGTTLQYSGQDPETGWALWSGTWTPPPVSDPTPFNIKGIVWVPGGVGWLSDPVNVIVAPACIPESLLAGDLDCDCDVDVVDIMMVAAIWDTQGGDERFKSEFDFDDDGRISVADIMYVVAKWNTYCP